MQADGMPLLLFACYDLSYSDKVQGRDWEPLPPGVLRQGLAIHAEEGTWQSGVDSSRRNLQPSLERAASWAGAWDSKAQSNQQSRPGAPCNRQLGSTKPTELPPPVWAA